MLRYYFLWVVLGYATALSAQYQQQILYSNQNGQTLLNSLVEDFTPDTVLGYGPARDTMFSLIDSRNSNLSCVYTGFTIRLDARLDPTQDAFAKGINTEHTWPQSNGAGDGFPRSDMHHLYPTLIEVNADRGSFPFADIPDNQTQTWYYLDETQSTIPGANIDDYSEKSGSRFEPREDHKGNVARSMFYFYTIYRAEANAAAPTYFAQQREELCRWHYADPVDEVEWNRTQAIAKYQDDKANPFVLDCTLPERTYCNDVDLTCLLTNTKEPTLLVNDQIQVSPNPFLERIRFDYNLTSTVDLRLTILDARGALIGRLPATRQTVGPQYLEWTAPASLALGTYFYSISMTDQQGNHEQKGGIIVHLQR